MASAVQIQAAASQALPCLRHHSPLHSRHRPRHPPPHPRPPLALLLLQHPRPDSSDHPRSFHPGSLIKSVVHVKKGIMKKYRNQDHRQRTALLQLRQFTTHLTAICEPSGLCFSRLDVWITYSLRFVLYWKLHHRIAWARSEATWKFDGDDHVEVLAGMLFRRRASIAAGCGSY